MNFEQELRSLRAWVEGAGPWLSLHVLTWPALGQAASVLVVGAVLRLLAPRLIGASRAGSERIGVPAVRTIAGALAPVAPWIGVLLLLWLDELVFASLGEPAPLVRLCVSLVFAWVLIRVSSSLVRSPNLARTVAVVAWLIAALNIAGLIGPTAGLLNAMALTVGTLRLSVLLVLKGALLLVVLVWLANVLSHVAEQRLAAASALTPSMQVLAAKLLRISLLLIAVVVALGAVGIDLTAFAVFSGAIGVGVGFGLQKVVSNLISGVILLLDRSIKPGDVIEIEGTYGWITRLNARFVSVVTRDGTEHLIPNEDLITERVVNWSYTNDLIRLHVPFGISYDADVHEAMRVALDAVGGTERVLSSPAPVCLMTGFGDSTIGMELRFWISDPRNGTANVRSAVMVRLWDAYRAASIEFPYPQRDLHIRDVDRLVEAFGRGERS